MKNIVVICTGGFSKEVVDYLKDSFPNDRDYRLDSVRDLYPQDELIVRENDVFVVANGDPSTKRKLVTRISDAGGAFLSLIHPTAQISRSARIGNGALICPFAFIGPDAVLDPHVTLNVYAACGHDSVIGSYAVLSPYAFVAGGASVGENVFLGSYAFVAPGKSVGRSSKLSAGAIAFRDVGENCMASGNPAQAREIFKRSDG